MHGSVIKILHYALLSAWTGVVMDAIVAVRNWAFVEKDTASWARHPAILYVFMAAPIVALPFVWEGYISLLPALSMVIGVYARWQGSASTIRVATVIGLLMWTPYTIAVESYAGTASNLVVLGAVLYSMVKNDGKRKDTEGIHDV